ncbi:MAG: pyrroline-5-carboxylate reductase [Kordiimonadaceae bacterium]|nr:pyrroline-5-carboxylate reductase [Kordiimonadaceae bacterium]
MRDHFSSDSPLVLVGCGHMGRALAEGWLEAGLKPEALVIVDPAASVGVLKAVPAENFIAAPADLSNDLIARAVVLAVKPQIMASVFADIKPVAQIGTLVVSIAGGITLATIADGLGDEPDYVRAMPNTPAAVGAGITGLVARAGISDGNRALACDLFAAVGSAVWVPGENHMNTVTAVSGSGPAYVFHLIEVMAAAGVAEGLPADMAMQLAKATVAGAGELAEQSDEDPSQLRINVTSPGGTTAAALAVLMDAQTGFPKVVGAGVKAAAERSKELGK